MNKAVITAISGELKSGKGSPFKSVFFAGDDNGGKGYGCFDNQYSKNLTEVSKYAVGDEVEYETSAGYLKKIKGTPRNTVAHKVQSNQPAIPAPTPAKGWVPDPSKEIGILTSYCLEAMVAHKYSDPKQAVDLVFIIRNMVEKRLNKTEKEESYDNDIQTLAIQVDMDPTSQVYKTFSATYKSKLQLKLDLEAVRDGKKDFVFDPEGNLTIVKKG